MEDEDLIAFDPNDPVYNESELDEAELLDLPEEEGNYEGVLEKNSNADRPTSIRTKRRDLGVERRGQFKCRVQNRQNRKKSDEKWRKGSDLPGRMFNRPQTLGPAEGGGHRLPLAQAPTRPRNRLVAQEGLLHRKLPLSRYDGLHGGARPMPVDPDAAPRGELGNFAPFRNSRESPDSGNEIEIIEVRQVDAKVQKSETEAQDELMVDEDEITFLGQKRFDLRDYDGPNEKMFKEENEPEVIDIASDDPDFMEESECPTDNDNEVEIIEEINSYYKYRGPEGEDDNSGKVLTETTKIPLSERIERQKNEKAEEISSQKPILDPAIFHGKLNLRRLVKALRCLPPASAQKILKRGRKVVLFKYIPNSWTQSILLRMCEQYGRIKKLGVNQDRRFAKVWFFEEESAMNCENNLYNQVKNDTDRYVLVKRCFDFNPQNSGFGKNVN